MKSFVLLTVLVFASKNDNDENAANSGERITENTVENSIVVKIEEDEYTKKISKSSKYIGLYYIESTRKWIARRWSSNEKKLLSNGMYRDEETAARASDTLARRLIKNGEGNHRLNFPDDNIEVYPKERTKRSEYFGVTYDEKGSKWRAYRQSSNKKKSLNNGAYRDEETAAHASDTLARELIANGEQDHKLNFPHDKAEVYAKGRTKSSKFIGVYYKQKNQWCTQRWSRAEKQYFTNGDHKSEETAARASDTLARKLIANGEQGHKLNFPDENTEVYPEKTKNYKYVGVTYHEKSKKWKAQRWSKTEKTNFSNGNYRDEETAAHASDTLARKLMANGEQRLKLNFPDDDTEVNGKKYQPKKRKRSFDFDSQTDTNGLEK